MPLFWKKKTIEEVQNWEKFQSEYYLTYAMLWKPAAAHIYKEDYGDVDESTGEGTPNPGIFFPS